MALPLVVVIYLFTICSILFDVFGLITLSTIFFPASTATFLPASKVALPISFTAEEAICFAP